ncbi:MAG: hypothetical protein RR413_08300 [Christensenellaceae bacterium]
MITIDYALRIYTDQVNMKESIDLDFYKGQLTASDFKEFEELIPFIGLAKASKTTATFKEVFLRVDARKNEIYNVSSVANFRAEKIAVTQETLDKIDVIFDEEFSDE